MRETRRLCNYSCQTLFHTLKYQDVLVDNIVKTEIAMTKSTANKSSCDTFCDRKIHTSTNTAKVTNVIKSCNDKFVKYAV